MRTKKGNSMPELKPGARVQWLSYGQKRTGKIVKTLGTDQVLVIRDDNSRLVWLHKESVETL